MQRERESSGAAAPQPRFLELKRGHEKRYLDTRVFRARALLTAELFLLEADARAAERGRLAFCHVVGLGLGVWAVDPAQKAIAVDAYAEAMHKLELPHVRHCNFSWFDGVATCGGVESGGLVEAENGNRIRVHFNRRDPADAFGGKAVIKSSQVRESISSI